MFLKKTCKKNIFFFNKVLDSDLTVWYSIVKEREKENKTMTTILITIALIIGVPVMAYMVIAVACEVIPYDKTPAWLVAAERVADRVMSFIVFR